MPRTDPDAIVVLVRGDTELASWPFSGPDHPDLAAVEELARLQLSARRVGCAIRLREVGAELTELLDLLGLTAIMAGAVWSPRF